MELTDEQLKFLVEVGLNVVMKNGAGLFITSRDYPAYAMGPMSEKPQ